MDRSNEWHEQRRRTTQDLQNSKYFEAMIKGPVDLERRLAAAASFRVFCETYYPERFHLSWAPYHLDAIERITEVVLDGASYALTMPRGSGKSTLCQTAVEWGELNGHADYMIYVGATADASNKRREAFKTSLRFNQLLLEDYPEICGPIRFTEGEARKAGGQRFMGNTTGIRWGSEALILPTLEGFEDEAKWYKEVKYNFGSIIDFASIDGNIRGRSLELPTGKVIRPKVAIVDDPQTRESARNPTQVAHREMILKGDIGYLGGPDRKCGVMVPCTVVYEDDLADRLMDNERNPEFRGTRSSKLVSMPGDGCSEEEAAEILRLWEVDYDEKRRYDLKHGTTYATQFYLENREVMDRGAEASWEDSKESHHASSIESSMCLYLANQEAFYCEAQNQPRPLATHDIIPLKPDDILERALEIPRNTIPADSDVITAFIDISRNVLWWSVVAWNKETFGGQVVNYGAWPEQPSNYFTLNTARRTIPDSYPMEYSAALTNALGDLVEYIENMEFLSESGERLYTGYVGVDSGWGEHAQTVYQFCRRHPLKSKLISTKGYGSTPLKRPLVDPERKRERRSDLLGQWKFTRNQVGSQLLHYDTNLWKSRINGFLRVDKHSSSGLTLFGGREKGRDVDHRMFAEQLCAEKPAWLEGNNGRRIEVWTCPPSVDNHFLDTVVGNAVLANILGARLPFTNTENANVANMKKQSQYNKATKAAHSAARRKRKWKVNF